MSRNEGTLDRGLRAIIGILLIAGVVFAEIASLPLFWGAIVVGVVLLLTSVTGFCPAYRILGINTCRRT